MPPPRLCHDLHIFAAEEVGSVVNISNNTLVNFNIDRNRPGFTLAANLLEGCIGENSSNRL